VRSPRGGLPAKASREHAHLPEGSQLSYVKNLIHILDFVNIFLKNILDFFKKNANSALLLYSKNANIAKFIKILFNTDMKCMDGLTVAEMAEILGIAPNAVAQRLFVAKIKPLTKDAIYDRSALDAIRDVAGKGRPRKAAG
jgi:hypothetical protein